MFAPAVTERIQRTTPELIEDWLVTMSTAVPCFADQLAAAVRRCGNPVVVGLDPRTPAGARQQQLVSLAPIFAYGAPAFRRRRLTGA